MAANMEQYAALGERLAGERDSARDDLERVDSDLDALSYDDSIEGAVPTNHPADEGSDVYERERLQSVRAELRERLDQIEAALQRMADGTYGRCANCGREIPLARLEALPWASLDVQCQEELEGGRDPSNKPFPPLTPHEAPPA